MNWMLMPLRRYADFSGRSRRKEYWMFMLFNILVVCALMILMATLGISSEDAGAGSVLVAGIYVLYAFAIIIPSLAVQVRRFHDQDKSGWMVLLGLIPGIGGLIVLVFMCLEGTRGPNQYGPDPKNPEEGLGEVFS